MSFGKAGTMHGWTLDEKASEDVIKHALSLGINFFNPDRFFAETIHREIDGTLRRLGTDYLDLYIIHRLQAAQTSAQQRVACSGRAGRL